MSRKAAALVKTTHPTVPRIPGEVAFAELLERITERGVELDGGSKLLAFEDHDNAQLSAQAKRLELVPGINGATGRRRGAPMPRRD